MKESVDKLVKFFRTGRPDVKAIALNHLLGLTGTDAGVELISDIPDFLTSLVALLQVGDNGAFAKDAGSCLINISASDNGASNLLNLHSTNIIGTLLNLVLIENKNDLRGPCCMILANLTRPQHLIEKVVDMMQENASNVDQIVQILTQKTDRDLDYLAAVLANLSRSVRVRRCLLDPKKDHVRRLLSLIAYKDSLVRRAGVAGTIKNCCFESEFHDWLLSDKVDVLPQLLLPLAGNEEFTDEENDKLPVDLAFLPEDKVREEDAGVRRMLLEALCQLCATRRNRQIFREKNIYVVLRELHKWEKDRQALLICLNIVDILIRSEDEIGEDNLKELEVPKDLQADFIEIDQELHKEEDTGDISKPLSAVHIA